MYPEKQTRNIQLTTGKIKLSHKHEEKTYITKLKRTERSRLFISITSFWFKVLMAGAILKLLEDEL